MYSTFKYNLLNNWNIIRFIRLGLSIIIILQAIQVHDALFGFLGTFFMYQALTNTGCCGVSGCAPAIQKNTDNSEQIEFTEVNNK
jgi:hypothetical protein